MSLVRDLADEPTSLAVLAERGGGIAGHAILTQCRLTGHGTKVALLGPLAVSAEHRMRGVGRALVGHGLVAMGERGIALVCVLGDPAYYSRLGFAPERSIDPPYDLPAAWRDAWQSRQVADGIGSPAARLIVPPPWRRPDLWLG